LFLWINSMSEYSIFLFVGCVDMFWVML
jgi:hypothetical protein